MQLLIRMIPMAMMAVLVGCRPPAPQEAVKTEEPVATPAPVVEEKIVRPLGELSAKRVDGQGDVQLGEHKSNYLLLHFFGPWTDSGSQVSQILKNLAASGVSVLPVVVDERPADQRQGLQLGDWSGLPPVNADDEMLAAAGPVRALPTTVLMGPDGLVAKSWAGHVAVSNVLAEVAARPSPAM